jgi:hypothetical protein
MSAPRVDGKLLLRLLAQVEDLRERVGDLEAERRRHARALDRHEESIEILADALAVEIGDVEGEAETLQ